MDDLTSIISFLCVVYVIIRNVWLIAETNINTKKILKILEAGNTNDRTN